MPVVHSNVYFFLQTGDNDRETLVTEQLPIGPKSTERHHGEHQGKQGGADAPLKLALRQQHVNYIGNKQQAMGHAHHLYHAGHIGHVLKRHGDKKQQQ